jgi:hypothetical protein
VLCVCAAQVPRCGTQPAASSWRCHMLPRCQGVARSRRHHAGACACCPGDPQLR